MSPLLRSNSRTAATNSFRSVSSARRSAPAVAVLAAAALLALGGCGTEQSPGTAPSAGSTAPVGSNTPDSSGPTGSGAAATPAAPDPTIATEDHMTELLLLHAQLKTELGAAYSDAWIEDGQLHVAVTTPEAEAVVYGAGAIPARTEFTEQQLREAADALRTWLATDAAPSVELHWLGTSGRTGSITVRVPADQVQRLSDAVAEQNPAGAVKVIVEESSGPATPVATNTP